KMKKKVCVAQKKIYSRKKKLNNVPKTKIEGIMYFNLFEKAFERFKNNKAKPKSNIRKNIRHL
ncbi:MAG: hypothetical protein UH678_05115, partial [Fibrobacteraceae bacterium]|nr:hypothetical protein [Fibrobacteraceae bacterium]